MREQLATQFRLEVNGQALISGTTLLHLALMARFAASPPGEPYALFSSPDSLGGRPDSVEITLQASVSEQVRQLREELEANARAGERPDRQ